jgi:hypothetical protein
MEKKLQSAGVDMDHDIHEFVRRSQQELQEEYVRIQKRATEDPGTAGDQGEENWAALFRKWLPPYFNIVTKGRILTHSGYASPQIDLLILYPSYPPLLLDKKLYLSGGVAAAFECKTTLIAAHVKQAVATSVELKRALPVRVGSPYKELNSGLIYGLLAHSHSWQGTNSKPIENIEKALRESDAELVKHPRECIDLITVSDLATWNIMKMTYLSPRLPFYNDTLKKIYGPDGSASSAYVCQAIGGERQEDYFSPIGTLLSKLFSALAWAFPDMRQLEEYFRRVKLLGSGQGGMRLWDINIYSEKIRDRVFRGEFSNGDSYDEWHVVF